MTPRTPPKSAVVEDGGMYSTPRQCPCGESHLSRDLYWQHRLEAEERSLASANRALAEIEDFCATHLPFASEKSEVVARRVLQRCLAAKLDAAVPSQQEEK